jgi:hypothetical protein
MTFLTRLIARHRAGAPAPLPILEPRLPSRFEPVAFAATLREVAWDAGAFPHGETRGPATLSPAWVAPHSQERGEPPEGTVARLGAARAPLGAAHGTAPAPVSRAMPDARSSPSPLADEEPTTPPDRRSASDGPGSNPARATGEGRDGRPAAPPTISTRPVLRPPVPPPRTVRAERDTPEARGGPTIHVTIGRVDVRAVMTPVAPSPRPTASAETLSLEDYLRGRSGGPR